MKLYKKIPRLPDELLMSWLYRIAQANCIDLATLLDVYLRRKDGDDVIDYQRLVKILDTDENILDLFVDTGVYCFDGFGESDDCRMAKIAKFNLDFNSISDIGMGWMNHRNYKLCPVCVKEDLEAYGMPYLHRAHNLESVCVCYKHGHGLVKTLMNNILDLDTAEPIEQDAEQELAGKYAILSKKLLDAEFSFSVEDIGKMIQRNVKSSIRDMYADFKKSRYVSISKVAYKYFYDCVNGKGSYVPSMLALLMYIYGGNIEKLYADLENLDAKYEKKIGGEYEIVSRRGFINRYRHSKCGTEFCQVNRGLAILGCPKCNHLTFEQFVDRLTDGKYECKGRADKNKYFFMHKKCGRIRKLSFESLIMKCKSTCLCEVMVTFEEAEKIAKDKGFDLLKFTNTVKIARFKCQTCGFEFSLKFNRFANEISPCGSCNEKWRTDFSKKVREVYGEEFTVLGEYKDSKTDVLIRHNICGHEYMYQPNRFLMKKVKCRYCNCEAKIENRVGETSVAKNGMKMTIIAYRSAGDIDVQFEDGAIRRNVGYVHFRDGDVGNYEAGMPKTIKKRAEVLGMQVRNGINGKLMTITDFRSYHNVTVTVEDGGVFTTSLNMFRKGRLRYWTSKTYKAPDDDN